MTVPAEPLFLSREDVEEIHAYQTRVFGGSPGLRDSGLLESAVATPQSSFGGKFLYADVFEMAAAYMVSVIGIDYCEFTNFIDPMLTVIDHVLPEMGRAGTEMLIDIIEQKLTAPALRSFSPIYRPGDSVAPPGRTGKQFDRD